MGKLLQLPRTDGCIVCGLSNPHGLRLTSYVDLDNNTVQTTFTPLKSHIGFQGIVHGGVLATILDEEMVWAATWAGKRFCLAAEMTTRFKLPVAVGEPLIFKAWIDSQRSRLITAQAQVLKGDQVLVEASGKYVPILPEQHRAFVKTLIDEPESDQTLSLLRG